jgi:uncharacterized HAD superfamily protein
MPFWPIRKEKRMIQPEQLGFDIDGVIANTMQLFLDIARRVYGLNHIQIEDITTYNLEHCLDMEPEMIRAITDRIIDGDYPCRLFPIDGAAGVLKRLAAYGPIHMVTARPALGPIEPWIAQLLTGMEGDVHMVATGGFEEKADVLRHLNIRYFVEDRLETCYLLKDQGIHAVLFAQPWNRQRHPFVEVSGWPELEMLIDWS